MSDNNDGVTVLETSVTAAENTGEVVPKELWGPAGKNGEVTVLSEEEYAAANEALAADTPYKACQLVIDYVTEDNLMVIIIRESNGPDLGFIRLDKAGVDWAINKLTTLRSLMK